MLVVRGQRRISLGVCVHVHLVIAALHLNMLIAPNVESGQADGLSSAQVHDAQVVLDFLLHHVSRSRQQVLLREPEDEVIDGEDLPA